MLEKYFKIYKINGEELMIKNGDKGITLVSLVITIAVLMILSGVVLTATVTNNAFLDKTKEAKHNEIDAENEMQGKIDEIKSDSTAGNDDGVIEKTDTVAPVINNVVIINLTSSSFDVWTEVTEKGSGISKIEYTIDGKTWYPTNADSNNSVEYKHSFKNLKAKTKYTLIVKATDVAGKYSTYSMSVETK